MKGKADLVRGWLNKAASDLVAMKASAQAGALDAACFHAQQAAEKYLKAYLAYRDLEIIHTHNLYKLLNVCICADPSLQQLNDAAELLTPFAVEARYDTEFWPDKKTLEQAEKAANRVAKLISSLVRSVSVIAPAYIQQWKTARDRFSWRVDLGTFREAAKYQPGFFNRPIEPWQVTEFEDAFRATLIADGRIERAAEVVFWKNYGAFQVKNKLTSDFLTRIRNAEDWNQFVQAVKKLATEPSWASFQRLIKACGQKHGFATPITFLSFYAPNEFPMVDQRIGKWSAKRFPLQPQFAWAGKRIAPNQRSWDAYLAWTDFCRRQAALLSWRARDVEMAVWTDTDARLPLNE